MTVEEFRRLALALPETIESAHVQHPDFRVRNKIFATLGYPDPRHGMVKLTAEQQSEVMRQAPGVFRRAAGAWGRSGSTLVLLSAINAATLRAVMLLAWQNNAPEKRAKNSSRKAR